MTPASGIPHLFDQRALSPGLVNAILTAARDTEHSDATKPLSEQSELRLRHSGDAQHVVIGDAQKVLGYAQIAPINDAPGHFEAEGFVSPQARRQGLGAALVRAAQEALPESAVVLAWAHGDSPAAEHLAARNEAQRSRELWQMARDASPLPPVHLPEGITLRSFAVGHDEQEWLAVNAQAFEEHPEQGSWTMTDLQERIAEPWFDASGFLIAQDPAGMAGFHWTKITQEGTRRTGEVYVVGVAPRTQGQGLGRILTVAGINHLVTAGVDGVDLYVDASNVAAARLYRSLGFEVAKTDVQYTWHAPESPVITSPP